MARLPWDEKYRPTNIDEYVFQTPEHERLINGFISDGIFPSLLLKGHRGTGKTSLVYILKNALGIEDVDFMQINASDENSVDVIRTKVKNFVSSFAMGNFKLVFCDEADRLTAAAQDALRSMMQECVDNARFIFACNRPHKILPELRSRCQELQYKSLDKDTLLERAVVILQREKIKIPSLELLDQYVDTCYPDFRKLLLLLERNSFDGLLHEPNEIDASSQYQMKLIDLIENNKFNSIRSVINSNMNDEDWEDMYRFLYEYLNELGKFKDANKWKAGIIVIAEHLYKHSLVADSEINAAAMFLRLGDI